MRSSEQSPLNERCNRANLHMDLSELRFAVPCVAGGIVWAKFHRRSREGNGVEAMFFGSLRRLFSRVYSPPYSASRARLHFEKNKSFLRRTFCRQNKAFSSRI